MGWEGIRSLEEEESQQLKDKSTKHDKDAEPQRPERDGTLVCEFVPHRGLDGMFSLAHLVCERFVLFAHLGGWHFDLGIRVDVVSKG